MLIGISNQLYCTNNSALTFSADKKKPIEPIIPDTHNTYEKLNIDYGIINPESVKNICKKFRKKKKIILKGKKP